MFNLKKAPKMLLLCALPLMASVWSLGQSETLKENHLLPVYLVFNLNGNKERGRGKVINYFGR